MNATDRRISPVYCVFTGDVMLDAPIEKAWPHVEAYWTWNHFAVREHVSGEQGKEGEVVLLRKEEEGFVFPPYFARIIRIEPGRRLLGKTYPEKGTEPDFFGIVDFRLYPEGARTRFSYNTMYEFLVPYRQERELEDFRRSQELNFDALRASTFPKLQALCRGG